MFEDTRNAFQKLQIDGVLPEVIIKAGAFHAKLLGKPSDGSALNSQFITNIFSDSSALWAGS